jgi:acetyltransferase
MAVAHPALHGERRLRDPQAAKDGRMTIRNLEAMLTPGGVAIVGASPRPGTIGATVTQNLLAGRHGPVHLVNPRHTSIAGQPCYPSVAALASPPTLGIVATPPAAVPGVVAELAAAGARAAAVLTAGLDRAQTRAMLDAARPALLRVLGPNCIGLMLPARGLNATFAHRDALAGRLALVSQSGALVTTLVDWAASRAIGFSHVISVGDMADVDFGDLLDYLAGDVASSAILLYVEAVTSAPKFMSAARRAARAKPVVVVKAGRHETAAQAAKSHTGRLAGADRVYDAAFRRAGLLRVLDLDEMFDAAEALAHTRPPAGSRLAILTNGGGAGVLAADGLADLGGVLARLAPETISRLDARLPRTWSRANPVDIIGDADADRYAEALEALLADRGSDAVLVIHCPTALVSPDEVARRVASIAGRPRPGGGAPVPVLTNWLGGDAVRSSRAVFATAGLAAYETPRKAARGFMHLRRHGLLQDALLRTPPARKERAGVDRAGAQAIIDRAIAAGRTMLSEAEGKCLLAAAGVPVAPSVVAASAEIAAHAAGPLVAEHGAVVLKILSPDITHKSDVGGVVIDLTSEAAVRQAADDMLARVRGLRPAARIDGFTVAPMIRRPGAHELLVGASVDPTFGPTLMFGAGGTGVEVIADTAIALPPLDLRLARDLIAETRVSRLLAGYRDRPPADLDAIAAALVAVGDLVAAHPEIREFDVNPLLADDRGVIALDARVRLARPDEAPRTAMAIVPYPAEWSRREEIAGLGTLTLRPIRPEDELLYESFFARVTAEDRRLRFLAPKRELSHRFIARLTQIDYAREMAFVALDGEGEMLGVARLASDPDLTRAEFAILVRSDLQGRGLGSALMRHLIAYARSRGLAALDGLVLAENTMMLALCRELGFRQSLAADEPGVVHVRLAL